VGPTMNDRSVEVRSAPRHQPSAQGIVVVIPAFNEERFIASVVFQSRSSAEHVIVVDDGSSDRTAELAEAAGATVVRQGVNQGKAAALNAGFEHALEFEPRVVVCLDGDAQHEPAELDLLAGPILAGDADVVVGSRFLGTRSDIPGWRQIGQHTLTAMTNGLSGVRLSDSQSGYRAFSPTAVRALRFTSQGLSVESEMQFLFGPAGLRLAEVPISVRYQDGNKRNPVVHGLEVVDAMISMVARRRPLLFFSLPGLLLSMTGAGAGLQVVRVFNASGELQVGSAILTTLLFTVGMLLGVTGVILHNINHLVGRLSAELRETLQMTRRTDRHRAPEAERQA
jgi:hypothetical protein